MVNPSRWLLRYDPDKSTEPYEEREDGRARRYSLRASVTIDTRRRILLKSKRALLETRALDNTGASEFLDSIGEVVKQNSDSDSVANWEQLSGDLQRGLESGTKGDVASAFTSLFRAFLTADAELQYQNALSRGRGKSRSEIAKRIIRACEEVRFEKWRKGLPIPSCYGLVEVVLGKDAKQGGDEKLSAEDVYNKWKDIKAYREWLGRFG